MHGPSFNGSIPYSFRENDLTHKKVYAAADDEEDNDDAGKAIHMPRFCFAGETKIENLCLSEVLGLATALARIHLETHLLSGVMLVCEASNPAEDRYCTARQYLPFRQKTTECSIFNPAFRF